MFFYFFVTKNDLDFYGSGHVLGFISLTHPDQERNTDTKKIFLKQPSLHSSHYSSDAAASKNVLRPAFTWIVPARIKIEPLNQAKNRKFEVTTFCSRR